jgi:hypothetical protein
MTASAAVTVDLTRSWARREGGDARLVICLPDGSAVGGAGAETRLRLRSRGRDVESATSPTAAPDGALILDLSVPGDRLPPGVWKLAVLRGADVVELEARLVANHKQPIALLPGPTPTTKMPAPRPATAAEGDEPAGLRPKARRSAARAVDAALAVLPEARATKYRAALARVGRRVLG